MPPKFWSRRPAIADEMCGGFVRRELSGKAVGQLAYDRRERILLHNSSGFYSALQLGVALFQRGVL